MYDHILVPTDGTGDMDRVTGQALDLADLCEAVLHILYVVDETAYATVPDDARDLVRDALIGDGEDATRAIAKRAYEAGVETTREVRWGHPAATIIAYAVENDIEMIIMGTRGKTGFERFMLGSVAEKVVRSSPVPVLTVHIGERDALIAEIEALLEGS